MNKIYLTTLLKLIKKSEKLVEQSLMNKNPRFIYMKIGSHYLVGEGEYLDKKA